MTFFPSLNIFDAFELDVNVVNFVYCGKTRLYLPDYRTCRVAAPPSGPCYSPGGSGDPGSL